MTVLEQVRPDVQLDAGNTSGEQDPMARNMASTVADMALAMQPHLGVLDQELRDAEDPQPVLGVGLSTVRGIRIPHVYIAYAQTEPGQGLQPVTHTRYDGRGGRRFTQGLALPTDRATRKSVTFRPTEDAPEGGRQASDEGWWQQWTPDRCSLFEAGKEPNVKEFVDRKANIGSEPFSSWESRIFPGLPSFEEYQPEVLTAASHARDAIIKTVETVRDLPGQWRYLYELGGRSLHRRALVVGHGAVESAIEVLGAQSAGGEQIPQMLADMLHTVLTDLDLRTEK